ncbi:hypothetical protein GDO86_019249 [Hymenochirus boettgeri]|uniref:Ion transport domain-containing protein n=1 Tax=Hymenochirus boettgeri TaxID=247094 RepID=A0A8T2IHR1_9PIPI|nr:hypothetical protein GDO86_019249 [Hymenochirus boettgeri]
MLNIQPVKELLDIKWNTHGRPYLLFLSVVYTMYIICVSFCCANRPLKHRPDNATNPRDIIVYVQKTLQESYITPQDFVRLAGEIITVIGAIIMFLLEVAQVRRVGSKSFIYHQMWTDPFHVIRLCYSCLVFVTLVLRVTSTDGEVVPMSGILVLGWGYMMYFAQGFQMLGPFTIIIQKMAVGVLIKYFCLMAMVICGYSTALYVVFQPTNSTAIGAFNNYSFSLTSTYQLFLNILNGPANYNVDLPEMYFILYTSFCVIAFLLMFNLLIAMMGDIQAAMTKKKDELWRAQILDTTIMMEKRFAKGCRCCWCNRDIKMEESPYVCVEERRWHPLSLMEGRGNDEDPETETTENKSHNAPITSLQVLPLPPVLVNVVGRVGELKEENEVQREKVYQI